MLSREFGLETRKRKLSYTDDNNQESYSLTDKTDLFKHRGTPAKSEPADWKRAEEGFVGFSCSELEHTKPAKRKSLQKRQPLKYQICMPCDSEAESEVENTITWSSSGDDLSPASDKEESFTVSKSKSRTKGSSKKTGKVVQKRSDIGWQNKIDSEGSENELEGNRSNCESSKQNEIDIIEDTDSRSSFTFSNSSIKKNEKENQNTDSNEDIQVQSSVETEHSSPDQRSKVKASDWVKTLDLKTPTKQSPTVMVADDSAKKKKKYSRNGLADQLNKLQIREKSAIRVWNHQTEVKASSKSVVLHVQDFESLYSLQLARCTDVTTNLGDGSIDNMGDLFVLFTSEMADDMNIVIGSIVRIFPPWQKLKLKTLNKEVLLCTNYIKVEGKKEVQPHIQETSIRKWVWECPCVSGLVRNFKQCPAFQFPCIPGLMLTENLNKEGTSRDSHHEQSLMMIQGTQSSTPSGTSPPVTVSTSILESIDKASAQTGVSFKALIHRVFCKIGPQNKKRYSLLVADKHGIMCEIYLPEDTEMFDKVIKHGEGGSFIFSGLKVMARTTRDRDPVLFSMIDSVWSPVAPGPASEESQSSTSSNMSQVLPPGFCYSMGEHDNPEIDLTITGPTEQIADNKPLNILKLINLQRITVDMTRVTLKCRILTKLRKSDCHSAGDFKYLLYITDSSLSENEFRTVKVKDGFCMELDKNFVYMKDVLWLEGSLFCDCYSCLDLVNCQRSQRKKSCSQTEDDLSLCTFLAPAVHEHDEDLDILSLCTVKGVIHEIDESSAYSWDACDKCGSDKLAEKATTSELVCVNCKRVVHNPVSKMKMEVFITCPEISSHRLKTDLSEDTIKSLLPEDDNDEGYDIGSVLNSAVGPITCVVTKKTTDEIMLKEIKILS